MSRLYYDDRLYYKGYEPKNEQQEDALLKILFMKVVRFLDLRDPYRGPVIAKCVKFSWLPRRLTLKGNPPIYHWLWFNF